MKVLIAILSGILFISPLVCQTKKLYEDKRDKFVAQNLKKIVNDLPSIFITFRKRENYKLPQAPSSYEIAWFVFHNNLKTKLRFCVYDSSLSRTGSSGIYYDVESGWATLDSGERRPPLLLSSFPVTDQCREYVLGPGGSYNFGVPVRELPENTRLRIHFNFPWESDNDILLGNEVMHVVYISSSKVM